MSVEEEFRAYQLAYHLVTVDDYDILHINNESGELWLEKLENKTSKVIRIIQRGYDWKNHLKEDIARVFQKTKAMKKFLFGRSIEIHNIYISSYTPIDEWEMLKKPMKLKDRTPTLMYVYYLEDDNYNEEVLRLQNNITASKQNLQTPTDVDKTTLYVKYYKHKLINALHEQRSKVKNVLSFGKPLLTYILLLINAIMFIIVESSGGSTIENLIFYGAKFNPAIIEGEWWRIISSMFLHVGFLHFFMNMVALYYLGIAVERIYGSLRFIIIYLLAGIAGGVASFAFTINVAAGASGAIFGLFGALLFFGLIHSKVFLQTIGKNLFIIVGLNLLIGFLVPQIDNGAHVGGLIAGFLASTIVHLPKKRKSFTQIASLIAYTILIIGIAIFGLQNNLNTESYGLYKVEQLNKNSEYKKAINVATAHLEDVGELKAYLLFQRSYANIQIGEIELAIEDLEESVQLDYLFDEAFYNLAILYSEIGKAEKSLQSIKAANDLEPDNDDYIEFYNKLKQENE